MIWPAVDIIVFILLPIALIVGVFILLRIPNYAAAVLLALFAVFLIGLREYEAGRVDDIEIDLAKLRHADHAPIYVVPESKRGYGEISRVVVGWRDTETVTCVTYYDGSTDTWLTRMSRFIEVSVDDICTRHIEEWPAALAD